MKFEFSRQIFKRKYSNIKVHENPVQWKPSFSMWKNGQTDMTKLIAAFRKNCEKRLNGYEKF